MRLSKIFYINNNNSHHLGRPQKCAGGCYVFRTSKPHSGTLWPVSEAVAVEDASEVDTATLPVVDLTEEAILSDSVGISLPAILGVEEEEAMVTTEAPVNTEDGDGDVQVPVTVTTVAAITGPPDGDDSLNEVNTGNDEFHLSEETASAAKKYGYKIY